MLKVRSYKLKETSFFEIGAKSSATGKSGPSENLFGCPLDEVVAKQTKKLARSNEIPFILEQIVEYLRDKGTIHIDLAMGLIEEYLSSKSCWNL